MLWKECKEHAKQLKGEHSENRFCLPGYSEKKPRLLIFITAGKGRVQRPGPVGEKPSELVLDTPKNVHIELAGWK